jgi:hypothetical protein
VRASGLIPRLRGLERKLGFETYRGMQDTVALVNRRSSYRVFGGIRDIGLEKPGPPQMIPKRPRDQRRALTSH